VNRNDDDDGIWAPHMGPQTGGPAVAGFGCEWGGREVLTGSWRVGRVDDEDPLHGLAR
jgi:hypothetical protein